MDPETFDFFLKVKMNEIEIVIENERSFVFDSSVKYGLFLRHLLLNKTSEDGTLYVSVGEADWAYAFLTRLYQETIDTDNKPKIDKLVVLHLSEKKAKEQENNKILPEGFYERMTLNLKGLENLFPENKFNAIAANGPLNYHGYLYGEWALLGEWRTRDALGNVCTGLTACKKGHPKYKSFNEMFKKEMQ